MCFQEVFHVFHDFASESLALSSARLSSQLVQMNGNACNKSAQRRWKGEKGKKNWELELISLSPARTHTGYEPVERQRHAFFTF